MASPINYTQQERGLSSYQLPGCIQKHIEVPNAEPPHSVMIDAYPTVPDSAFNGGSDTCGKNAAAAVSGHTLPGVGMIECLYGAPLGDTYAAASWSGFTADIPAGATITSIQGVTDGTRSGSIPGVLTFSWATGLTIPTTYGNPIPFGFQTFALTGITTLAELYDVVIQGTIEASTGPQCYDDNLSFTCYAKITYEAPGIGAGLVYDRPVTAGNFLVVAAVSQSVPISGTVTDSNGNTWTSVFSDGNLYQVWYCTNNANAYPLSVQFPYFDGLEYLGLEIYGVDTVDVINTNPISVTTGNESGFFGYLLNFGFSTAGGTQAETTQGWNVALPTANFNSDVLGQSSSPYIAIFVRPFIPDGNFVIIQEFNIGFTL